MKIDALCMVMLPLLLPVSIYFRSPPRPLSPPSPRPFAPSPYAHNYDNLLKRNGKFTVSVLTLFSASLAACACLCARAWSVSGLYADFAPLKRVIQLVF